MCTADVVCEDFQARNRICTRLVIQDKVAVGLVAVRLLRVRGNVDHALPDRTAFTLQCSFKKQVAGGMRSKVILLGIMIKMLGTVCEIKTGHASLCSFAGQVEV